MLPARSLYCLFSIYMFERILFWRDFRYLMLFRMELLFIPQKAEGLSQLNNVISSHAVTLRLLGAHSALVLTWRPWVSRLHDKSNRCLKRVSIMYLSHRVVFVLSMKIPWHYILEAIILHSEWWEYTSYKDSCIHFLILYFFFQDLSMINLKLVSHIT